MPIEGRALPEHRLLVALVSERLTVEDVRAAIARQAQNRDVAQSYDRLVFIARHADLSELTPEVLNATKAQIIDAYFKAGGAPPPASDFRMAVVCPAPVNALVLRLFGALWHAEAESYLSLQTFSELPAALAWLGRGSIPLTEFADEMQRVAG